MNLISASIHGPVKVAVAVILVVVFGIVGLSRMPIQLTPEMQIPTVSVDTDWPGASPQEVEREIVDEQEEQLNTVTGVRKMESASSDSNSSIVMEFPVGSDIDATMLLVNNRLNQVKDYPLGADRPVIRNVDSANSEPIAWFVLLPLDGKNGSIDISKELTFAENNIEAELEKVPGVAAANMFGGQERRLEVVLDPFQLAARQITIGQLRDALIAQNQDTTGGDFWEGKRRYVLRTLGRFRTPEQVENVIIVRREGKPIYVRDVAKVKVGHKKAVTLVRQKGVNCIAINTQRQTGANVLVVMDGLKQRVKELNNGILKQRGLVLEQVEDQTEYITASIELVKSNIITAGLLTVGILLLFLRALRPTLVISLAIPTTIIGTFFLFSVSGRTLNVISLAGLAFAVGMVVDNAIVVMENIYRHYEMGKTRLQASIEGTKEVWTAVLASTLTTLAVFLPVIFVQEEAGQLFRDISIAISCAVGLSLIVAITVVPTCSARMLRQEEGAAAFGTTVAKTKPTNVLFRWLDGIGAMFVNGIVGLNRRIQRSVIAQVATVAISVGVSVIGSYLLWPSVEYLPEGNRNLAFAIMLPPPGYNIDQMAAIGKQVEDRLRPYFGPDFSAAEKRGIPGIQHFFFVAAGRRLFMGAKATDPERARELLPVLREAVGATPGMITITIQPGLVGNAFEGGRTVDVEITGDDLPKLVALGRQVFGQTLGMMQDPKSPLFGGQAQPKPSLDLANPEIHVTPKWEEAADLGITARDLGYALDALIDGALAGEYYDQNDKIDLEIVGDEQFARRSEQIDQLYVAGAGGELVPLKSVANIELSSGPEQINHIQRRRSITVSITPPLTTPLEFARQFIEKTIVEPIQASGQLEGGRFRIETAGTADKLTEAWSALWFNLVLALLITYLLMAGLFESFLYPFVIIMSVPLAAVGGFAALFVTNLATMYFLDRVTPLDILTMLGFVILIGTVVNNPILIVDQALQIIRAEMNEMRRLGGIVEGTTPELIRHERMVAREAVLEATRTRIRPIFMTTATTVLGLLPLVVVPGAGSEIYRGLGSVVLGGLVVSTMVTLVLIPALFTLSLETKQAFIECLHLRRQPPAPPITDQPYIPTNGSNGDAVIRRERVGK